jgi:uncharacterized cupin superfamily protein
LRCCEDAGIRFQQVHPRHLQIVETFAEVFRLPVNTLQPHVSCPYRLMKTITPLVLTMAFSCLPSAYAEAASQRPAAPKLASTAFLWDRLEVKPTGVGERRDVARNPTTTLDEFECHISTLNPGLPSHPPHVHPQEELIIIKEGTLQVHINGTEEKVGPGSLFFFASYDSHAVRNVGPDPATYYVFNFTTSATRSRPARPAAESAEAGQLKSGIYHWDKLKVTPTAKGERRDILDSPTVTLKNFESHVTRLRAGEESHASHRHPDEEIIVVKEGEIQATINGVTHQGGPGTIFFFASNDEHGLKNVGASHAAYYVIRIVTAATPPRTS